MRGSYLVHLRVNNLFIILRKTLLETYKRNDRDLKTNKKTIIMLNASVIVSEPLNTNKCCFNFFLICSSWLHI